jgi:hypothetical protein
MRGKRVSKGEYEGRSLTGRSIIIFGGGRIIGRGEDCMSEVLNFLVWGVCFMGFW